MTLHTEPQMGLDVWFPLVIYFQEVTDNAVYNPSLHSRIRELMNAFPARQVSPMDTWTGDVHNVDRLHWDPAFAWLTNQVGLHALQYLKTLGHDLAKTDVYIQRSWPTVSKRDQRIARHAHPTAHLSAVYYVAVPEAGDAGQLRFWNDARPNELSMGIGSDMTQGYAQSHALNYMSASYQPIAGRLFLFPAKQTHSVDPNQTDEERVSVAYDLVITQRDHPEGGHDEFLMPAPTAWKRVPRSEPEMVRKKCQVPVLTEGHIPLASLIPWHKESDRFVIPQREGHVLWTTTFLPDCLSIAALEAHTRQSEEATLQQWRRDSSSGAWLWQGPLDLQAYHDAIKRIYVHLRGQDIPLDGATATPPILHKREPNDSGPFQRGKAHLCMYLRLDSGKGDCHLEFEEGGVVPLPIGGLLIASGCRLQRLIGQSLVLQFQVDLPAIARSEVLSLRALQKVEVADSVVFAALTAQPISMELPTSPLLGEKLDWLEQRKHRAARNQTCPVVRRFLLEHADPASASEAELAKIYDYGHRGGIEAQLFCEAAVLSDEHCATLCRYAEAHVTSIVPDSVDDLPEYQVDLTITDLQELLGHEKAEDLLNRPQTYDPSRFKTAERIEIFLRKYSPQTRPYIAFHADNCGYTMNIALRDDESFDGGQLLALYDGSLRRVSRRAGTAVLHTGNLVHGVSRIECGTRYSLILFYH